MSLCKSLRMPGLKFAGGRNRAPAPVADERLRAGNVLIITDQGGQHAWWSVDLRADRIEEIPDVALDDDFIGEFPPPPRAAPVLSFSIQDYTAPIEAKDRTRQVEARFERNEGVNVEVLPRAKGDAVAFAAPAAWIENFKPQRLFPGTQALHLLLRANKPTRFPAVTGFILQQQDAPLLILYQLDATGQLSNMAYVPRAGGQKEISLALTSFAEERKMPLSDGALAHEQMTLFSAADLASVLPALRAYPVEPAIGTVPIRRIWQGATLASAAVCASSVLWAGAQRIEVDALQSRLDASHKALDEAHQEIEQLVASHFDSMIGLASIDPTAPLVAAQQVYTPGATVEVDASRGTGTVLTVTSPTAHPAAQHLHPAPVGCRREPLLTSNTANLVQARYECTPRGFNFGALFSTGNSLRNERPG
jgi:hypothetical protein